MKSSANVIVRKKTKKPSSEKARVERMYKSLHVDKRIYRRWMAGAEATISTTAGGVIALTTLGNAASISAVSDFSSVAALYTAYRCKAIRVQLFPNFPVPVWDGTAARFPPTVVAVFPWQANTVPTTFAQAQDVTGVQMVSGYKGCVAVNTFQGDNDAHLWTGTASAIGGNEQFGISIIGTTSTAAASVVIYRVLVDYLVEFRMAG